ncbi:acryloyl-CoA reductase [Marinobacterium aestuarii]|uniref:Acryloyl-CoA reductase n=1 Tax=Marinobacterium aestuarii TaxID=1821621 RepID=A0A1A9EWM5_9GAMM|nr:MDR family oxidoreductase [Marinobacterium aestuarii]ANG62068.1 acryloyl-CoA reductase [Marinobacterium aestuarii]
MFRALVLDQQDGKTQAQVRTLQESQLPEGEVLVAVDYSSLNFKDGLAITGSGKIVSQFPMVPGVDLAGRVLESADDAFSPGDAVVLTGWGVGERHWGGMAEKARLKADWLVPMPQDMDARTAMMIGTAGLTAMLCVMALEEGGLTPAAGPVLVTGAAGGVGSVSVVILAALGYEVHAVTGRPETEAYLKGLGAHALVSRESMASKPRALEAQRWAGAIDTVGDTILARVLAETHYGGTVAACGLAAGFSLPTTVMPFILRNVRLQGVDSVMCPLSRRQQAWQRLARELPAAALGEIGHSIGLDEVPDYAQRIVEGQVRGRVIVDMSR